MDYENEIKFNIIIINLKNNIKRRESIIKELRKSNLFDFITIFNAVDKKKAKKNMNKYVSYNVIKNIENIKSTTIIPTLGAVGCAISHFKCWERIVSYNMEHTFIVEDDSIIYDIDKFKFSINSIKHLNKKLLNTKNIFVSLNKEFAGTNNSFNKINDLNHFRETNFYYINKRMAIFLIRSLLPLTYQIDLSIYNLSKNSYSKYNSVFLNLYNSGVRQDKEKFKSDVQYKFYKKIDIYFLLKKKFNLDNGICINIHSFLPQKKYLTQDNLYFQDSLLNGHNIDLGLIY